MKVLCVLTLLLFTISCSNQNASIPIDIRSGYLAGLDSARANASRDPKAAKRWIDDAHMSEKAYRFPDSLRIKRVDVEASVARAADPAGYFTVYLAEYDKALEQGDSIFLARLGLKMANIKIAEGQNRTAERFLMRSEEIFRRQQMTALLAQVLLSKAQVLRELSDSEGAQSVVMEALRLMPLTTDAETMENARALIISGNLFADIGSIDMAFGTYRAAYALFGSIADSLGMAESLGNIGLLHRNEQPDSAESYYQKALLLAPVERYPQQSIVFLYNLTNLYLDRKQFNQATIGYDSLLSLCRSADIPQGIPRVYSGYASVAAHHGDFVSAVRYYKSGRKMADSLSMRQVSLWLFREEVAAREKVDDPRTVIDMMKRLKKMEDSVLNVSKVRAISELELQYRTETREREVKALRLRVRNIGILALLLFCITGLLFAGVLFYRQRNRSYRILVRKYEENRVKEDLIIESIRVQAGKSLTDADSKQKNTEIPFGASHLRVVGDGTLSDEPEDHTLFLPSYLAFEELMKNHALWKNAELKVEEVADRLGIPARRMTAVMRAGGQQTFLQYVNRCRVDEVIRCFHDPGNDPIRTDALGLMSGFSSRSHFYRVFKEMTGVTPGVFREFIGKK